MADPSGREATALDIPNPHAKALWHTRSACPWCRAYDDAQPSPGPMGQPSGRETTLPDVPYDQHEREVMEVMAERDAFHEWADRLAEKVAAGRWIGEHSSENNPWQNALDLP